MERIIEASGIEASDLVVLRELSEDEIKWIVGTITYGRLTTKNYTTLLGAFRTCGLGHTLDLDTLSTEIMLESISDTDSISTIMNAVFKASREDFTMQDVIRHVAAYSDRVYSTNDIVEVCRQQTHDDIMMLAMNRVSKLTFTNGTKGGFETTSLLLNISLQPEDVALKFYNDLVKYSDPSIRINGNSISHLIPTPLPPVVEEEEEGGEVVEEETNEEEEVTND